MDKNRKQQSPAETNVLQTVSRWIVSIIVVIVLAIFLVQMLGRRLAVEGHSMEPALNAGDVVLLNHLSYHFLEIDRFDVVQFESDETNRKSYIKRVIGLPGEKIQIRDGSIYISGELLDLGKDAVSYTVPGLAENTITLKEDEYFLLGDNGDSSEDSRFAVVGNVNRDQILGKVWFRIAPFKNLGFVKNSK